MGGRVVDEVFPDPFGEGEAPEPHASVDRGLAIQTVRQQGGSAVIIAADIAGLIREACRIDGMIAVNAQIGDFVPEGQPLFHVFNTSVPADEEALLNCIAFGVERTIEQDSTFAFRVIVDIALKALSKAINDPTTAVLAIDQLQRLLLRIGERNLRNDTHRDVAGHARLVFPTPNWDDFVQLTCREIRMCGADSIQVARRLRAMLRSLKKSLPPARSGPLVDEDELLMQSIRDHFPMSQDMLLASSPDVQGLGGASWVADSRTEPSGASTGSVQTAGFVGGSGAGAAAARSGRKGTSSGKPIPGR